MKYISYTQFYRDRAEKGIEYAAAHAAELGFDGVEYFGRVPSGICENAAYEREVLSRYGLEVACYSVMVQLLCDDPARTEAQMLREIEAAEALGSPCFHHTLFPPYSMKGVTHTYEEVLDRILDSAERIAKECDRRGILCLYEPQGVYFNGTEGLSRILRELRNRDCRVNVCGDFGNSFFVDVDPCEIFDRFAREIRHVHVKDYLLTDRIDPQKRTYESLSGKLIYDTTLGTGAVNFSHGFRALRQVGYDGAISFELEGSDRELREALTFVKQTVAHIFS